ncbi:hypothetical protein PAHAL_3G463600 [Panicum hallii]|uniref:Uncharacterized protein n=1 Tax=Panicum hallii TaxID=206008 RepID=A0A2T8KLJ2_9POAL|nr:hypothetical protein PAHAL_3G463600 [Panicum hallii]
MAASLQFPTPPAPQARSGEEQQLQQDNTPPWITPPREKNRDHPSQQTAHEPRRKKDPIFIHPQHWSQQTKREQRSSSRGGASPTKSSADPLLLF